MGRRLKKILQSCLDGQATEEDIAELFGWTGDRRRYCRVVWMDRRLRKILQSCSDGQATELLVLRARKLKGQREVKNAKQLSRCCAAGKMKLRR